VFLCLSLCYIHSYSVAAGAAVVSAYEPSLIGECINTFSCIGKTNNFKPPDIILAAFFSCS
jgi:hypothetical protein